MHSEPAAASHCPAPSERVADSGIREALLELLPAAREGLSGHPHILLVDDDPTYRRALARSLERAGGRVVQAAEGQEALRRLESGSFDVIVSDVNMPLMDGLQLVERTRERDPDLAVVLISGESNFTAVTRAMELRAARYLLKPVADAKLLDAVHHAVGLTRASRQRAHDDEARRIAREVLGANEAESFDRFTTAVDSLWLAHQPIVNAHDHSLAGYELLMRFDSPGLDGPPALLELASRFGRLDDLGRHTRDCAAQCATGIAANELLFVNLHASDLSDERLRSPDSPLSKIAPRVVLEVTERASLDEVRDVDSVVSDLRALGFRIAVDDLGAGYSGLNSLTQLEPEFVKLDMSLVRDVDKHLAKQRIVGGLISLARELNMTVVSEGVETEEERQVLVELGSHLLQGYLVGRPSARPERPTLR